MLFNTLEFGVFFFAFFVLFHFVALTRSQRLWLITFGSCVFYCGWNYKYLPLLLGTALADFYIAREIGRDGTPDRRRKRLLFTSIALNLGVLGLFKYLDFGARSVFGLLHLLHLTQNAAPVFGLVLPIRISFYTFQSMSYTIDVFKRELRARQKPLEFLAGVTFFPHLVAGPIIRASTLLPQFEKMPPLRGDAVERGFLLIGTGLLNKTVADMLGIAADRIFSAGSHSGLQAWTGAIAFTAQVYGDFCGYTDIAIGCALLLGIELPPNFNLPYISSSPIDFWNRWHISFSHWLRDYLYIPLGWKRRRLNLVITMVLGGLWHGANWTFVIWGAYHGVLLVVTRMLAIKFGGSRKDKKNGFARVGQAALVLSRSGRMGPVSCNDVRRSPHHVAGHALADEALRLDLPCDRVLRLGGRRTRLRPRRVVSGADTPGLAEASVGPLARARRVPGFLHRPEQVGRGFHLLPVLDETRDGPHGSITPANSRHCTRVGGFGGW